MSSTAQVSVQISLAVTLIISIAYAAGRAHQWYRRTFERDTAYREGYDQASLTLFPLAVRKSPGKDEVTSMQPAEYGFGTYSRGVFPGPGIDPWYVTPETTEDRFDRHHAEPQKGWSRS